MLKTFTLTTAFPNERYGTKYSRVNQVKFVEDSL